MTADACDHRAAPVEAARAGRASDRVGVRDAFDQLQPLHREVICKACHLRWTTTQIAADLDVTEAVVKSELHCALHALRRLLADPTLPR